MSSHMNAATSSADDNVPIETLSQNICEAVGIADAQLVIVIDKNNAAHVFTGASTEAESMGGAPVEADFAGTPFMAANFAGGPSTAAGFGGGRPSMEIRHEPDGCWWLIKRQQTDDGSLIEASRICIGAHGCPVGKRIP